MRTVRRLRLRYLLFTSTPDVLPSSLAHHVESISSPSEAYWVACARISEPVLCNMLMVEMLGIEPRSTAPSI